MKNSYILVGAALVAMNVFAKTSTPAGWTDDFDVAIKRATAEKKLVLADFSGSDWCCWCQRLDKEVFATEEFMKAATNKYVCLMVDSPSDQSLLSEKAKKQNPILVKLYHVRGFPTVLVMDTKGDVLFKTGYQPGGPAKYLEHLEKKMKEVEALKPIKEKLEKARAAIDDETYAGGMKLTGGKQPDWNDQETAEKLMDSFSEVLQKRLPEYRKAIDEAKATQVPAELEAEKKKLVDDAERVYGGMLKMSER